MPLSLASKGWMLSIRLLYYLPMADVPASRSAASFAQNAAHGADPLEGHATKAFGDEGRRHEDRPRRDCHAFRILCAVND